MPSSSYLRRRIVAAHLLLSLVVCGLFALVAFLTFKTVERNVIDSRLVEIADNLSAHQQQPAEIAMSPYPTLLFGSQIPASIRALGPGIHEIDYQGRALHVLVRIEGERQVAVVDNQSRFERIEQEVAITLTAAFAGCLGLAWVLGRATASRVIAPVAALASAVMQDSGARELPSLRARDEIGELARAFQQRTQALAGFLNRERVFSSDVSHELRTPLTVIYGGAELLCASLSDHPRLLEVAERIRRTAADMSEQIATLLLLSRSPGDLVSPRISLRQVVERETARCKVLLEGKPVALILDLPAKDVRVNAHPELITTLVGNLLRNACRFTESGHVAVRLTSDELVIEDTGIGVPVEVRHRLFERFLRGGPEEQAGSGLGLAIVKRVADHLGWTVEFEPGAPGSRFLVRFAS